MSQARLTSILILFGCVWAAGCNQPKGGTTSPPAASEDPNKLEAVTRGPSDPVDDQSPAPSEQPTQAAPAEKPAPPPPNIAGVRTHVVQRGETLWGISQKYYGDGKGWNKIYAANRNRIRDPKDVPTGTKLIIP